MAALGTMTIQPYGPGVVVETFPRPTAPQTRAPEDQAEFVAGESEQLRLKLYKYGTFLRLCGLQNPRTGAATLPGRRPSPSGLQRLDLPARGEAQPGDIPSRKAARA